MQNPTHTHAAVPYAPDPSLPLPFPGCPAFLVIMKALERFVANKETAETGKRAEKLVMEVAMAERLLEVMMFNLCVVGGEPN